MDLAQLTYALEKISTLTITVTMLALSPLAIQIVRVGWRRLHKPSSDVPSKPILNGDIETPLTEFIILDETTKTTGRDADAVFVEVIQSHSADQTTPKIISGRDQTSVEPVENLEVRGGRVYRVAYATNRAPLDADRIEAGFSSSRGGKVTYGNCDVYIPKSHKIGSVGSSAIRRILTLTDDRLIVQRTSELSQSDLWRSFQYTLSKSEGRHAVLYLHGYNVSFESAAIRAAQIGADLNVDAMAMFSWPSKGNYKEYISDEASLEASTTAITDFLVSMARNVNPDAIHVIAHSMGNRGLLRAFERIQSNVEYRSGINFGQIILAAPDVDVDSFGDMAVAYAQLATRTTLYVSDGDRAVGMSAWLHSYPRVGYSPPVSVYDGIDTVSVTNIDTSAIGHGYVNETREILNDMHQLIFSGLSPDKRFGVQSRKTTDGKQYWAVAS